MIWQYFETEDAVYCYCDILLLDSEKAWFSYDDCGKYEDIISYLPDLHEKSIIKDYQEDIAFGAAWYFSKREMIIYMKCFMFIT